MKSDGSIIIDTKILDDGMEKGFEVLKDEMASIGIAAREIGEQIEMSFSNIDVTKAIANAGNQVRNLEAQLAAVTSDLNEAKLAYDDKAAERLANQQIRLYDRLEQARERLAMEVSAAARKQAAAEEKAAQREAKARQKAIDAANKPLKRFESRLRGIASGALVFNLISAGLRSVTQYFGKSLKSNDQFSKSLARLKGALLTAFQPIYEFVVPVLTTFVNLLTLVVSRVGQFFAMLSGKSVEETSESAKNLYEEANAIEATGAAAKKAMKSLAGFDEINKLDSAEQPSGGGGGGGSSGGPDFSSELTDETKSRMEELLVYISGALLAVGAVLAFSGVNIPLGIGLMVAGAVGLATAIAPNWNNMSDSLKYATSLVLGVLGGAFLVIGAILAFSGASVGKGIALMAIGAAALGTAVALNWDSIRNALQGPIGVVVALVSGALLAIGAILAFTGHLPLGIALIAAGAAGLVTVSALNWSSIVNSLRGPVGAVVAIASGALLALGLILAFTGHLPLGIALIAAGAGGLVTVTALNWNAIKEKLASMWTGIKNWFNTSVKPKLTLAYWKTKFANIATGLTQKIKDGINAAISLFNRFISWINSKMSFSWGDKYLLGQKIISAGSIQLFTIPQIPMLAKGAVIPPNAPFMAMLGDQKHGTNIEAPLSTIQEAVAMVMQDYSAANLAGHEATVAVLREILEAVLGIEIGDKVIADAVQRYNSRMAVVRGG